MYFRIGAPKDYDDDDDDDDDDNDDDDDDDDYLLWHDPL